jgi:hypothetical protein
MAVSLKENNWFFVTDQTPCPYLTRSLPDQFWHRDLISMLTHIYSIAYFFTLFQAVQHLLVRVRRLEFRRGDPEMVGGRRQEREWRRYGKGPSNKLDQNIITYNNGEYNRPIGENSPNLATLIWTGSDIIKFDWIVHWEPSIHLEGFYFARKTLICISITRGAGGG